MLKGLVIDLKPYEKRAILRFMGLYFLAYFAIASSVSFLYYFKEYSRISNENIAKHRIKLAECERFNKLIQLQDCSHIKVENNFDLRSVYYELALALSITSIMFLIFSYFLARHSLRPVRDSINLMDNFINTIIHDINTPLSVIKINAKSLYNKLQDEKLQNRSLRILNALEHIESLEEQLLYSIRSHSMHYENSTFDLHALLQNNLDIFNALNNHVEVRYEGSPCLIDADEQAIFRLILNIVSNGVKFSPPSSKVEISLSSLTLRIQDYGGGIKNVGRIFEKYYRENNSAKGLGLGLFIVHEIGSQYNIGINIESSSKGTLFNLDLSSILHR